MGISVKSTKIEKAKTSLGEKIKEINRVWFIVIGAVLIIVLAYPIYLRQSHVEKLTGPKINPRDVAKFELPVDEVTTSPDEKYQSIIREQSALIAELKKQLEVNENSRNKTLEEVVGKFKEQMTELEEHYKKKIAEIHKNNSKERTESSPNNQSINIRVKSADELLKQKLSQIVDEEKVTEEQNATKSDGELKLAHAGEKVKRYAPPVLINNSAYIAPKKASDTIDEEKAPSKKSFSISGAKAIPYKPKPAKVIHSYAENKDAGILPIGSMMPIVLLNGLDAGAGAETQKNPQPIMVRIQKDAIVPVIRGAAKYKLKGCFLLGTGYGDISSERVYIKAAKLSCVDPVNKWIVTGNVNGFFADSDNVQGLRGKVEMRDGAKIAKSMLASFVETMSSVAGQAATAQSAQVVGTSLLTQAPSASSILASAGAQGFASAFKILAEKFAKDASNIHPIITISGGRKAYLIITGTSTLQWRPYSGKFKSEYKLNN